MSPTRALQNDDPRNLQTVVDRAFSLAVRVVKLCKFLEKNSEVSKSVINQLLDAATSVGANLEEAVAAQSTADFIHKNAISLKEARETNYWLRLINATETFCPKIREGIIDLACESMAIARIIAKRIITTKRNR